MTSAVDQIDSGLFATSDVPEVATRRARILGAAEPKVALPAAVSRSGNIISLTLERAALTLRGYVKRYPMTCVDVETSGYPIGHPDYELRTIQLGGDDIAWVFDATDPAQRELAAAALNGSRALTAYSASADITPLVHAGLIEWNVAWAKMHDTMLSAKLADPNLQGTDAGLKATAAALLGDQAVSPTAEEGRKQLFAHGGWLSDTDLDTPRSRNGWYQVDNRWQRMVVYAAGDVLDTAALRSRLPDIPQAVSDRERAVQEMTARISLHGLRLDRDHIRALLDAHGAARDEAQRRCTALGVDDPGSNPQVSEHLIAHGVVVPKTEAGNASVTSAVLNMLANSDHELAPLGTALLAYRKHTTLLSTFLRPYWLLCEHGDGRVRPTIYTLTARTGRMSSVRPNKQNVPREGGIRACDTADSGYLLVSADLASIELRVAAAVSGDETLTEAVVNGTSVDKTDIHWLVAKQVFGQGATKSHRYTVKPGVYGYMYGAAYQTLAEQMGCDDDTAKAVVDALERLTPQYVEWANKLKWGAKRGKNTYRIYTGVDLILPLDFPHKWPNYVIQRTARDKFVDGMLKWGQTRWGKNVVLPVHDELITMAPGGEAADATAALVECMTGDIDGLPVIASANEPSFAWQDAA